MNECRGDGIEVLVISSRHCQRVVRSFFSLLSYPAEAEGMEWSGGEQSRAEENSRDQASQV